MWQTKGLVLLVTMTITLAAIVVGWAISSYKSEGYFQMEMSFSDFKRLQTAVIAPSRWEDFAKTLTKTQLADLNQENFVSRTHLESLIEPIYPVTRSELRDVPSAVPKNEDADISGLKISYKAATPLGAQHGVFILGDFLRDTTILLNYRDLVRKRFTQYQANAGKFDNETIAARYELNQLKIKKASMQTILREYPDSTRLENRQPITITDGNERFLSPVTQLVAIETQIAEKTQNLPRIIREQQMNTIYLRYYGAVQALLNKSTSGDQFLAALPAIKNQLNLNLEDEVERSVFNNITIDNMNARSLYVEKTSFIAQPIIPQRATPGMLKSGLLGLLLGLILGSGIALFRYFYTKPTILPAQSPVLVRAMETPLNNLSST
ncbi:hypothetical protein ACVBEF_10560 [Glaciimonas sp. GG7]